MELPLSRASAFMKRNRTTHSWYGDWSSAGCIMSQSLPSARTLEEHMRNARAAMSVSSSFYQPRATSARPASSSSSSTRVVIKPRVLPAARKPVVVGSGEASTHPVPSSSASSPGPTTAVKIPQDEAAAAAAATAPGLLANGVPSNSYSYDGGFFVTANNSQKDFFVIDPEWVSEEEAIKRLPEDKQGRKKGGKGAPKVITAKTYKRSKSAPPSNHRISQNPITWQE